MYNVLLRKLPFNYIVYVHILQFNEPIKWQATHWKIKNKRETVGA